MYNILQNSQENGIKLRVPCFLVGITQLTIISFSIYEKIWEFIGLEEPVEIWQQIYTFLTYSLEMLITYLLLQSSYTGNTYGAKVWLVSVTPFFFAATVYAFVYPMEEGATQIIVNTIVVGIIWYAWWIVLRFYLQNKGKRNEYD